GYFSHWAAIKRGERNVGRGEFASVAGPSFKECVEEQIKERLTASEALIAIAKKLELERRTGFEIGEEGRGAVRLDVGHSHEDERTPAHAQQTLDAGCAVGHAIHAAGDLVAE